MAMLNRLYDSPDLLENGRWVNPGWHMDSGS